MSDSRTTIWNRRSPSNTKPAGRPPTAVPMTSCTAREIEAVAGDFGLVDPDFQDRHAGHVLDLDLLDAAHALEHGRDPVRGVQHRLELVAEYADREILPHARDQLVETHLDRLRERHLVAGDLRGPLGNIANEIVLGQIRVGPLLPRLQDDVGVGGARRHRVGGEIRRAAAGEYEIDLREFPIILSLMNCIACDWASDVLGIRFTSMTMFFSSSFGMNS